MELTTITLHSRFHIGRVDPRIFGGFVEHLGRAIYGGIYDPDCAHADEEGCRSDVLQSLSQLHMTAMRYPGGNFVSGYHWMDGVGPRELRPTVRELAWQSIEPNRFGTDEYIRLCRRMGWTPMLAVNLGTGTPEEARNWVEYCNCPTGSRYSNLRAANGSEAPYGVGLWCLGNEMDGPWQLGHVPADQYAIRAQQAAKMMKDADPSVELIACGSCTTTMPTYAEWDRQVLEYVGDLADYVSLHRYVGNRSDDTADYLAVTNSIDCQIEEMDAVCRYVQAKRRSKKRAYLCFDEWNVWYRTMNAAHENGHGQFAPHLLEEVYNLEDALVVAGFLNSFVRHADVVKIANLAQIVNAIAPLLTRGDELLVQSIYYPFEMFSSRRDGVSLRPAVEGPGYESKSYGQVRYVDTSAILSQPSQPQVAGAVGRVATGDLNGDRLSVFAVNRSLEEPAPLRIGLADRSIVALESTQVLTGPGAKAANSFAAPDVVRSRPLERVGVADGEATAVLPPLSVAAFTFRLGEAK